MKNHSKILSIFYSLIIWLHIFFGSFSCGEKPEIGEQLKFQVCVYGGSEAGFTAAIQAARMGKSVVLIEPTGHPGGMLVEGIAKDIRFGSSVVIGGITRELYTNIENYYGRKPAFEKPGWVARYEPHIAEQEVEELLSKQDIRIVRNARIKEKGGVVKIGSAINYIVLENDIKIAAKVYVDASIEGDLLHFAGISTETIREGNAKYGETKNGIRHDNTYRQFEKKIDPYIVEGDSASGLIPTVQAGELGVLGSPDKHIQGFCFRLCLTREVGNIIPIEKPVNYNELNYKIYRRYLNAGGALFYPQGVLPGGKTDLGSWHDLSANLYGENWEYPAGDYATRERIIMHHRDFTQGLIWFLQHDPSVPADTRVNWDGWGLCKDEFRDNAGWPRRLYVRSARRMVSDYVITEHHTRRDNPVLVADPVAIAWWPPDTHHARRIVQDGYAYNEGFVFGGEDWRPFGISWKAIIPKGGECTNLISPTCPSSSYIAYGAIRIVPTFMILGQSAGCAASMVVDEEISVQELEYRSLRERLNVGRQILEIPDNWLEIVNSVN